jgi:transcriptional regulator with XRE-family HTH domain
LNTEAYRRNLLSVMVRERRVIIGDRMSPFAEALRQLRFDRGVRQYELADRVGCERSYVSAIENDLKQAPGSAFVDKVCAVLQLDEAESASLHQARRRSRRGYSVPAQAPKGVYEFAYEFFTRLDSLSALQLQSLMITLQLGDLARALDRPVEGRIRRRDRRPQQEQEDAM